MRSDIYINICIYLYLYIYVNLLKPSSQLLNPKHTSIQDNNGRYLKFTYADINDIERCKIFKHINYLVLKA